MSTPTVPLQRALAFAAGVAMIAGLAGSPVLAADLVATSIDMTSVTTPVDGVPFTATVVLTQDNPTGPATGATGAVNVTEGAVALGTCTLVAGTCDVTLTLATGDHTLTVSYPGDGVYADATRDLPWPVAPNSIDATGVGLSYGTFYPYKDGYRDTVTARGTRNEAASVTVKVYSPTGKLLKTSPTIASATGAYAWPWNGRSSSGTMYPAGKYKITQTLNDGYMTSKVTTYVTLSAKRLYTYTKTLTKNYSQRSAQGTYSVAWKFTLPSATVYKKLVFAVYAKSSPTGWFGPHDFTICSKGTWDLRCASPYATIGKSYAWRKVTGSVSRNRSGTYVRLYAEAGPRSALKYGRVIVTYGVLK